MAKRKRSSTHRVRHHATAKHNPRRRRHHNPRHHSMKMRHNRRRTHRNPDGKSLAMKGLGVFGGVAAVRLGKSLVPSTLTSGLGTYGSLVASAAAAAATAWVGKSVVKGDIGEAMFYGALGAFTYDALNAFLPSVAGYGPIGDIVMTPNNFTVPNNQMKGMLNAPVAVMPSKASASGTGVSGFRGAFGARR